MPAKQKKKNGAESSWRGIQQTARTRSLSDAGRAKRLQQIGRFALLLLLGISLAGGIGYAVHYINTTDHGLALTGPEHPLTEIIFETDGVLTREWLDQHVRLPRDVDLMDIQIFELRETLEAQGQIATAAVERVPPGQLRIVVAEERPMLRIALPGEGALPQILFVSETGSVYRGFNYSSQSVARMPFVDGVNPRIHQERFLPLENLEPVRELLSVARTHFPDIYADWRVISCRDYFGGSQLDGEILRVHTRSHGELILSPRNYATQLARLRQVLAQPSVVERDRPIQWIDLSLQHPVLKLSSSTPSRTSTNAHPARRI